MKKGDFVTHRTMATGQIIWVEPANPKLYYVKWNNGIITYERKESLTSSVSDPQAQKEE